MAKPIVPAAEAPSGRPQAFISEASRQQRQQAYDRALELRRSRFYQAMEKLAALETPLDLKQIGTICGKTGKIALEDARWIPWVTVRRCDRGTYLFSIDRTLKAICEWQEPHVLLNDRPVAGFLLHLRKEINRRRKEANDKRDKHNWTHEGIIKLELVRLLDWIENELDKIVTG